MISGIKKRKKNVIISQSDTNSTSKYECKATCQQTVNEICDFCFEACTENKHEPSFCKVYAEVISEV